MRGRRHVLAAVVLMWATTGCGASDEGLRGVEPTMPQPSESDTGADSTHVAVALVLASGEGVDLIEGDGERRRLSHQPSAVAYGITDDLVVHQGGDSAGDVYPPTPRGSVEMWSDGTVHELPMSPGATSVRLLDAGLVNDGPVALVAETFNEGQPEHAAEALVQIDLEDLTRLTVVPRQLTWESGHQAARLLPGGDIVALYRQGVETHLVRWSFREGRRAWSVKVAEDRVVSLAVSDASVAVVQPSFDKRRGFAPTLTVTRHNPVTGEPQDSTVVDVADPEGAIDTALFCSDWLTTSALACARSGGPPVAIADDGSFHELVGPSGAIPSVVRGG